MSAVQNRSCARAGARSASDEQANHDPHGRSAGDPRHGGAATWREDALELLTSGRERQYLQHFFERLAFDQGAIEATDLDRYASAFSAAGAMRAGFEVYRAFDSDGDDNRAALAEAGKLKMPVLGLGGTSSFYLPIAAEMLGEIAADVRVNQMPRCGHWIAEENSTALLGDLTRFLD